MAVKTLTPVAIAPALMGAALSTDYTVPANTKAIVKEIILYNSDTVDRIPEIHFVPSGGAAGNANKIWGAAIAAGETVVIALNTVLAAGDFIQSKADAADKVSRRYSVALEA
jgi:hypothetical protein